MNGTDGEGHIFRCDCTGGNQLRAEQDAYAANCLTFGTCSTGANSALYPLPQTARFITGYNDGKRCVHGSWGGCGWFIAGIFPAGKFTKIARLARFGKFGGLSNRTLIVGGRAGIEDGSMGAKMARPYFNQPDMAKIARELWGRGGTPGKIGAGSSQDAFRIAGTHRQKLRDKAREIRNLIKAGKLHGEEKEAAIKLKQALYKQLGEGPNANHSLGDGHFH